MKRILILLVFLSMVSFVKPLAPVREFRANWVAALGIDWPKTLSTGNQSEINRQKAELIEILDRMQAANMNVVFLHIRPMADAFYPTQLTTWSKYLTGTRGKNPGYDPLAFAIEEAHKRGLELHGWMNPYRYTSGAANHPSNDYMQVQYPEWLLDFGDKGRILDPGLPAVRTHIALVTKEVIVNYPDIDGIVWDDYFYISSISGEDADTFRKYNPQGLSLKDWRRDNVNKTVKEVYDTIQAVNPGIRFGISPRGIWSIDAKAAKKYGVTLPQGITGADNYNSIYCDALAWLSQGTIDYISPQLYWATYPTGGKGQDYNVLAPWWQSIADKYGRHFYSSHALYRGWEQAETGRQIIKNRQINSVSPGSVFYNTSYFKRENYDEYLKANYYQTKILPPVITWKGNAVMPVADVQLNGKLLSWTTSQTDGSFVLFAVPEAFTSIPIDNFDYMLTRFWAKNNTFDLSKYNSLLSTHKFAIASVDRFARMSTPVYATGIINSTDILFDPDLVRFRIENNRLYVRLSRPENLFIYTLGGTLVYQGRFEGEEVIDLDQGVYVLKVKSVVKKIII